MFCEHCGTQVSETDMFCGKCGWKLKPVIEDKQEGTKQSFMVRQGKKIAIGCAVVVALCAIVGGGIWGYNKHLDNQFYTMNINDYVELSYDGISGHGEMEYKVDFLSLQADFCRFGRMKGNRTFKKLKEYYSTHVDEDYSSVGKALKEISDANIEELECIDDAFTLIKSNIHCSFDKEEALENGEEIEMTITNDDNDSLKQYGIEVKADKIKKKVEGLQEAEVFDPFQMIQISIMGYSPILNASLEYSDHEYSDYFTFTLEKEHGIKNGEDLIVNVDYDADDFFEKTGCVVEKDTYSYKVDGYSKWVDKLEEIPEADMNKMIEYSKKEYKKYVKDEWEKPDSLKKISYVGCYLKDLKMREDGLPVTEDTGMIEKGNILYFIFKVTVDNPDRGKMSYYCYTGISSGDLESDGSYTNDYGESFWIEKSAYGDTDTFDTGTYYYSGFEKLEDICKWCGSENEYYTSTASGDVIPQN